MSREFFNVALTKMSFFKGTRAARDLLGAVADVTGIPPLTLRRAEWHMARYGSIAPLKHLLTNPAIPKADKLRYKIGFSQSKMTSTPQGAALASRFNLRISTVRGTLHVEITVVMHQQLGRPSRRQVAQISAAYTIEAGLIKKAFKQQLVLAGDAPMVPGVQPLARECAKAA